MDFNFDYRCMLRSLRRELYAQLDEVTRVHSMFVDVARTFRIYDMSFPHAF